MKREIKIFKSFEEQERYQLQLIRNTTPHERFLSLFRMQQLTKTFHPVKDKTRRIIIHKDGHTQ
jgi:hypothetical protein